MAQTDNPFLDGMAKMFTDAAGMAQGVRAEIDTFVKQRLERLVAEMDFVPREEFEAVKAMAAKARAENEALAARIAALESKISSLDYLRESAPCQSCGIFNHDGEGDSRTLVPPQNLVPVWSATASFCGWSHMA